MKEIKVGLQLYSVRDKMQENMEKTLQTVKEIGYDYVEFAGFFDKKAEEVKLLLDKYNLKCISVHQNFKAFMEAPEKTIEYLKKIGIKFCAIPSLPIEKHKGGNEFENTLVEIEKLSKMLKAENIQMLYHNHDYEFNKYENKYLLDWLYDSFDDGLLKPEIDTCWAHYSGVNPCEYLEKYTGQIDVVHLKDYICKYLSVNDFDAIAEKKKKFTKEEMGFEFRPVGYGVLKFDEIIKSVQLSGAEYIIVEQDNCYDGDSLECAKMSCEYLRNLGF